jgi:cation transport regulator
MTYNTVKELPKDIRERLPEHAQEIYCAAYNLTVEEHLASHHNHDENELQDMADQAAWQRVQMEYHQDDTGNWRRISIGDYMDKGSVSHG